MPDIALKRADLCIHTSCSNFCAKCTGLKQSVLKITVRICRMTSSRMQVGIKLAAQQTYITVLQSRGINLVASVQDVGIKLCSVIYESLVPNEEEGSTLRCPI